MRRSTLFHPAVIARWALVVSLAAHALACSSSAPAPAASAPHAPAPSASAPAAAAPDSGAFAPVHAYLQDLVDRKQIAGAVAVLVQRGEVVYQDAVGMRDVEAGVPMTMDTIFRLASMTKPITSVAAMMLVEEGKLSLDDPVHRHIPALRDVRVAVLPDPAAPRPSVRLVPTKRPMTIRDLLSHTSGLAYRGTAPPTIAELYASAKISDGLVETPGTMAEQVQRLARLPLVHQPGASWTYGHSVDVLGHVVEVVSGMTLERFFYERIFRPLGMKDTHFHLPAADAPRLAAVYQPRADQTIERVPEGRQERGPSTFSVTYPLDRDGTFFAGGAGLVSTAGDYARFLRMLQGGGELDGVRLLSPETVALMTRDHLSGIADHALRDGGQGFGLGFSVVTGAPADPATARGLGPVGTYGWGGFFNTQFWIDPANGLVAVVMTQLRPNDHIGLRLGFGAQVYTALEAMGASAPAAPAAP